ncbi:MAG TPA: hypothetical protein VNG35_02515 [Gemmatimonadales bacterium]|nr:hypothetical protein [Gemmatimonadales bacterium]
MKKMKHYVKPECRFKCRFLEITPALWLCPHAAFGEASYLKGAVEDARVLLARAGGYDVVLARVVTEEDMRRTAKAVAAEKKKADPPASEQVRYG